MYIISGITIVSEHLEWDAFKPFFSSLLPTIHSGYSCNWTVITFMSDTNSAAWLEKILNIINPPPGFTVETTHSVLVLFSHPPHDVNKTSDLEVLIHYYRRYKVNVNALKTELSF